MRTLLLFPLIMLFSCRAIMGVSDIKEYKAQDIKQFLHQSNINDSVVYFVDKEYKNSLLAISKDSHLLKNHLQPLQVYYFSNSGSLISYHINCNAPGAINLNWNSGKVMEFFPPKTQTEPDSLLNLASFLKLLKSSDNSIVTQDNETDYYIVVCWAAFLKKQSRRLIETVQKNQALNTIKKLRIIYVNTDNLFLE